MVALLAVLAAGGAYLPLDPTYPSGRLADSQARVVLTDPGCAPPSSSAASVEVAPIDPAALATDGCIAELDSGSCGENLANVMYTFGSTGRPKCVQVPHRALVNLLRSMSAHIGLAEDDRWLAVTSLSFDIAGLEVFAPLLAGAELVVLPDVAEVGLEMVVRLATATIAQATPSLWRMLIDAGLGEPRGVRAICGGETLAGELAAQLASRVGALWNAYGPTETTIWSCLQPLPIGAPVTIGRPLHNTRVHVLDADLQPVRSGCSASCATASPRCTRSPGEEARRNDRRGHRTDSRLGARRATAGGAERSRHLHRLGHP